MLEHSDATRCVPSRQKRKPRDADADIPRDVYVREEEAAAGYDGRDASKPDAAASIPEEAPTVKSGRSRASTFRSALSRKSLLLRERLGRKRSGAPGGGTTLMDETIASDDRSPAAFVAMGEESQVSSSTGTGSACV